MISLQTASHLVRANRRIAGLHLVATFTFNLADRRLNLNEIVCQVGLDLVLDLDPDCSGDGGGGGGGGHDEANAESRAGALADRSRFCVKGEPAPV